MQLFYYDPFIKGFSVEQINHTLYFIEHYCYSPYAYISLSYWKMVQYLYQLTVIFSGIREKHYISTFTGSQSQVCSLANTSLNGAPCVSELFRQMMSKMFFILQYFHISKFMRRWKARSQAILTVLKSLEADFFCLQVNIPVLLL